MSNTNYILTSDGSFISDESLYHYGIKGMRWGIRRYQNPDGSLTPAGRKHLEKLTLSGLKRRPIKSLHRQGKRLRRNLMRMVKNF